MCLKTRERALKLPYHVCLVRPSEQKSKNRRNYSSIGREISGVKNHINRILH